MENGKNNKKRKFYLIKEKKNLNYFIIIAYSKKEVKNYLSTNNIEFIFILLISKKDKDIFFDQKKIKINVIDLNPKFKIKNKDSLLEKIAEEILNPSKTNNEKKFWEEI